MKKNITLVLVLVLILGGFLYFNENKEKYINSTVVYLDQNLGFEFTYKTGPNGYIVEDTTKTQNSENIFKKIVLMQTKDKKSLNKNGNPIGGESPATITISIFKNTKNRQPGVWVMENTIYSNYKLKLTDPTETVISGANAVKYKTDGLYASNNVVVAHGGYIYIFTGMYLDENSPLNKDFSLLMDSVAFIPTSPSPINGKINIEEVCNGALAYMSFPDNKAADQFIQDCKDGKHPEVIEKFKKDLNLGDGAAI